MPHTVFDPAQNKEIEEKVYGEGFLQFFYPEKGRKSWIESILFFLIAKWPLSSYLYGFIQKRGFTKNKIEPFVKDYQIDLSSYEKSVKEFNSFNDFFIRKLKQGSRKIDPNPNCLIKPADGRYLLYPAFEKQGLVDVKGQKLDLLTLTQEEKFPWSGSTCCCLIRLAPVDYHRFHFPADCKVLKEKKLPGFLYSVSARALKKNISYLVENKRCVTTLFHPAFGTIYMVEVGATHVGSIQQTYSKKENYSKGMEKGFFEFGGSFIALVLENRNLQLDELLVKNSTKGIETLGYFGETLLSFND
jgi:phosphatidylserine decarboxylase